MKAIEAYKKHRNRLERSVYYKAKFLYTQYRNSLSIVDNEIVFQSYDGTSISGNPYYMLREVCNDPYYADFKKYVVTTWRNYTKMVEYIEGFNDESIIVIKIHSDEYCKIIARAKYLITNATFAPYFIKREGQCYLNTWHGTPLKCLGRQIKDSPNEIGNTQRNFLMADYLLYPNEFTFERMRVDYMLEKYYTGKYVIGGYPRNTAFFNDKLAAQIKEELELTDKKVVVYMPTWRGNLNNKNSDYQFAYTLYTLYELDKLIDDDTILFVKLHSLNNKRINYAEFEHIEEFPSAYETYEFLNAADCLITDYSSVFFDYANTGRKIILYGYDKERYLSDKGMYMDFDSLPFTFAQNVDELFSEISSLDSYTDYSKFNEKFTEYDSSAASKELCDLFFKGKKAERIQLIDGKKYHNNKPNILVFGGTLAKNGITTALKGFIKNIDKEKYNVILTFYKGKVESNKNVINEFNDIDYIPIQGEINYTFKEANMNFLFNENGINTPFVRKSVEAIYKREKDRVFPYIDFAYAVHFSGYERAIINLMGHMDSKRIIFVHNDMKKEAKTKGNVNVKSYSIALRKYDKVACVRKSSRDEVISFVRGIDKDKVVIVHNFIDTRKINRLADKPIEFNSETISSVTVDELNDILSSNSEKIINIGRFSYEKGLDRLILAFNDYRRNCNENAHLILVGGYGVEYNNILNMIEENEFENIVIIKSIRNPFPILCKCDLFMLSSRYEGLPMTIMESLALDVPVISTDIPGPSEFLKQGYGNVVADSQQGIYDGLVAFNKGTLKSVKKFDINEFNADAKAELDSLFD